MALTPEERQIVEFGKSQGKTKEEAVTALAKYRQSTQTPSGPVKTGFFEDAKSFSIGFSKGVAEDAIGTARLLQGAGQRVIAAVDPTRTLDQVREETGFKSLGGEEAARIDELLKSDNTAEKAGKLSAFIAGLLIPAGSGGRAKKAVDLAAKEAEKLATGAGNLVNDVKAVTGPAGEIVGDTVRGIKRKVGGVIQNAKDDVAVKETLKAKGKNAVDVFDETGSSEFMNLVDKSVSKEDLLAKKKMLDVTAQNPKLGGSGNASKLPRSVIAEDYVVPRVEALRTRLEEVGKVIGDAEKGTNKFQRVDARDVFNHMVQEAKKLGVHVSQAEDGGELIFTKANGVGGIDQARISALKTMFEGLTPGRTGSVLTSPANLAKTRRNLSALTKRSDAAKEVVAPGGPIDSTRRFIAQKLGSAYHNATKEYSDIARVLEQLDPDLKVKLSDDALDEVRNIKFADLSRRLLSNNAAQAKSVFRSLDELFAKEAARTGKAAPTQDLEDLVDFAGALEEGFGIVGRNSFFGQTKAGAGAAIAENLSPSQFVTNLLTKPKRDDKRALEAMKRYLDDALSK